MEWPFFVENHHDPTVIIVLNNVFSMTLHCTSSLVTKSSGYFAKKSLNSLMCWPET